MGNYDSLEKKEEAPDLPDRILSNSHDSLPNNPVQRLFNEKDLSFDVSEIFKPPTSTRNDAIISFPYEILHEIFLYLETTDLLSIILSCQYFHAVTNTQYFWKRKYEIEHPLSQTQNPKSKKPNWKQKYFNEWFQGDQGYRKKFLIPEAGFECEKEPLFVGFAKIITVGDSGVGKTSIVKRFIDNSFEEAAYATIGAAFLIRNLRNAVTKQVLRLEIWDLAGEERYRSLSPMYYRGCSGATIVYAINCRESFDRAKKWADEIRRNHFEIRGERAKVLLIGNKCDLEKERQVSREDAERLVEEKELDGFVETSAKDNTNIWAVYGMLTESMMKMEQFSNPHQWEDDEYIALEKSLKETNNSCV